MTEHMHMTARNFIKLRFKMFRAQKRKKRMTLPWWVRIISWLLVIGITATSLFFVLMYGIQFGQVKCTKWITSLVTSFFTSMLCVQPLKVNI